MSTESNKQFALNFIEEVWNGRNVSAIPKYMVEGTFLAGNVANGVNALSTSFPDYHINVEDIIVEEDKVVLRTTMHGTNTGMFMGHPAAGKAVQVGRISINKLKDGKIVSVASESDWLVLYQQLGITPKIEGAEVS